MSRPNQRKLSFEEREVLKEQMHIFRTFWGVAVAKLQEPISDNKNPLYQAERKEINDLFSMGVKEGLVGGVCTFAVLRMGPRLWNRFRPGPNTTTKKAFSSSSSSSMTSYKFDSTTKATTSSTSKTRSFVLGSLKLGFDLIISTSVAAYFSISYINPDKFIKNLADIPLVPGRSIISERICGDYVNLYTSIPKQTWAKHRGVTAEMNGLILFCENCIRRQTYEKQLQEQQQQDKQEFEDTSFSSFSGDSFSVGDEMNDTSKFIAIPSPGVPKDLPIDIPWSDRSDAITNGKAVDDWASFVFQEDDDVKDEDNDQSQFDTSFENDEEKQKGRRNS